MSEVLDSETEQVSGGDSWAEILAALNAQGQKLLPGYGGDHLHMG